MPLLITYQGKPVKRRRRVRTGLQLSFYSPLPGQPGERLIVTQTQWQKFGRIEFVTRAQMPGVRRMPGT